MGQVVSFPVERRKPVSVVERALTEVIPIPRRDLRTLSPNHPVFSGGPKGAA